MPKLPPLPKELLGKARAVLEMSRDPFLALKILMPGMKLPPHQQYMLKKMWRAEYIYSSSGRSTGKTAFTGIFLMLWCATHPGTRVLLLGLKKATVTLMLEFCETILAQYPQLAKCIDLTASNGFVYHGSDAWKMKFNNGSIITGLPSDINKKGARVRGFRASILCIDEIAAIPQEIVRQVFMPCASIRDRQGFRKIIKLTTGGTKPSAAWDDCRLHYLEDKKGNEDYAFFNFSYKDVPPEFNYIIDASAIRNMEANSSPEEAAREIYGHWTIAGGNYYPPEMLERNRQLAIEAGIQPEYSATKGGIYVLGVDPARSGSDETAISVLKKVGPASFALVESHAVNNRKGWVHKNAELVLDYIQRYEPVYIGIDKNGGEELIAELRHHFADNPDQCPIAIGAPPGERGRLMVRLFAPSSTGTDNNTRLNSRLFRALDGGSEQQLGLYIPGAVDEGDSFDAKSEDEVETDYKYRMLEQLDKLCVQLVNINAKDMESGGGYKQFSSTMKKDRYSATLYGFNCAEELLSEDTDHEGAEDDGSEFGGDCAAFRL